MQGTRNVLRGYREFQLTSLDGRFTFMRTLEQTTQEILELATKHFKAAPGSLKAEDDFYRKLGIDSLQALELLSRLEDHFHIELPDYEVQGVSDFKALAERVQARL